MTKDQTLTLRYRVACKLGHGVGSTVWLVQEVRYESKELHCPLSHVSADDVCRASKYAAVKACTRNTDSAIPTQAYRDIAVAKCLKIAPIEEHARRSGITQL